MLEISGGVCMEAMGRVSGQIPGLSRACLSGRELQGLRNSLSFGDENQGRAVWQGGIWLVGQPLSAVVAVVAMTGEGAGPTLSFGVYRGESGTPTKSSWGSKNHSLAGS